MSYRDSYLSLDPTNTDSLERAESHEGLQIRIDPGLIEKFTARNLVDARWVDAEI
jgi:hypothetical protein